MWQRIQRLLIALSMLTVSACGTLIPSADATPRCKFDQKLMTQSPDNLPEAKDGALPALLDNRVESKAAYKALYLKHRDLSAEATNCIAAQEKPSALDSRVERMNARIPK